VIERARRHGGLFALLAAFVVAPAASPNVARLVLQPAQVGKGYVMLARADGKGVNGQVTMNLCGTSYPSERLRTTRLQVNYLKARSTVGVSNEVVTYRSGGAAQAMREAIQHAVTCPHRPIDSGVTGLPKLTFRITRISDPRLLKGYLAVRIDVSGTVKGKHIAQTSYAVYQRLGNVLSGIYSFGTSAAGQRALCLHAAEASARNLRRGTSGVTSAPTA
jgi:hypothetical protein